MNEFDRVLEQAAAMAEAHAVQESEDYTGPDGLLVCGKCGTRKQCRVTFGGRERVVGCLCRCAEERLEEQKRQLEESQRRMRQRRLKRSAITDSMLQDARFETARPSGLISKARNYAANWGTVRENNVGLLLMGGVGVGKSYAAACICNALLEQDVSCHMTSLGRILGMDWEERARYISTLSHYELLVLDDLGAERDTEFANETVFSVIDERYRAKKPLIVTTNLGMGDLRNPENISKSRIYDRLLEICGPILCEGESFRRIGSKATRQVLSGVLAAEVWKGAAL